MITKQFLHKVAKRTQSLCVHCLRSEINAIMALFLYSYLSSLPTYIKYLLNTSYIYSKSWEYSNVLDRQSPHTYALYNPKG